MSPGRSSTGCRGPDHPDPGRAWPDNRLTPPAPGGIVLITICRPAASQCSSSGRTRAKPVLIRACPQVAHPCPDGNPGPAHDHRQETAMTTPSPSPRSGDDTCDTIRNAPYALAERRGAWLGDDLTAITLIASLVDHAERLLPELVGICLLNGHTWHEIAAALATSPEQAQLRYGPQSPIADTRWPYDL